MRITDDTSPTPEGPAASPPDGAALPPTPSEEEIRGLVTAFYGRVRADALLGPVFDARIEDWSPHLDRMSDFWSGILRASGRYRGNPIGAHAAIGGLEPRHFHRWLTLFEEVARETLSPAAARDVAARARRMSEVLQHHHPGIPDHVRDAPPACSAP